MLLSLKKAIERDINNTVKIFAVNPHKEHRFAAKLLPCAQI
jgi:hypothetical protein